MYRQLKKSFDNIWSSCWRLILSLQSCQRQWRKMSWVFKVSVNIFIMVCRTVPIFFYWSKELGWADLPDTLNMSVKFVENFTSEYEVLSEYSNTILSFVLLIFWIEIFFQMPLENFLWTLSKCSRYLKLRYARY